MDKEILKAFDGNGDVTVWLQKLKLVAELKNLGTLAALIPLYLEGAAFSVYNELNDEDKKDVLKIENCLINAFAQNAFSAFDSLRSRSWKTGEPVDVFLADLRRLAGLAGIKDEAFIRCSFICGLPQHVSVQLRSAAQIGNMSMAAIAEQARILVTELQHVHSQVDLHGAMAAVKDCGQRVAADVGGNGRPRPCYFCGGDHLGRFCPRRKPARGNPITCWNCGKDGHISRDCSGNDSRRSHAPALSKNM